MSYRGLSHMSGLVVVLVFRAARGASEATPMPRAQRFSPSATQKLTMVQCECRT